MTEDKSPGMEGYWSSLAGGGDEPAPTTVDLIEDCLDDLDEPEDLLGAVLTGDEDGLRYVLCATRKVRNGNLIMTLRFVVVDLTGDEAEARTGKNRIRLRVQGSLMKALPPLFASIRDGAATPDDPTTIDARNEEGVDHVGNALTTPFNSPPDGEDGEEPDAPEGGESDGERRVKGAKESVDRHAGARRDTVTCTSCGRSVPKDDAVNLGGALGADVWSHEGPCPTDDEEDGDDDRDGEVEADGGDMVACGYCGAGWHREAEVETNPCPACPDEGGEDR